MEKTIALNFKSKPASRSLRLNFNYKGNEKLVVWWYCGIYKNNKDESQPLVLVGFRKLVDENSVSDDMVFERFSITHLGQLRIGSIWKNGECCGDLIFKSRTFNLNFDQGEWKFQNFSQTGDTPFPLELHPLGYPKDKNWLLSFKQNQGKLVIPTLEFFTRCYGRSAELRRCLATYPWGVLQAERFFSSVAIEEQKNEWTVALSPRLFDGDAILIAHIKYDAYARRAAKEIYAQLEAEFDQKKGTQEPAYLKVGPWHQGVVQMRVDGIDFDDGKSFLGLRITGCSNPNSPTINVIKYLEPEIDEGSSEREASGKARRKRVNPLDPIELTSAQAPDADAVSVEIQDPDFEVLGNVNPIVRRYQNKGERSARPTRPATDASLFSSGVSHGNLKGVGYAHIHTKPVLESQGVLRDMWKAMLFLKQQHPLRIKSVMWYTLEGGLSDAPEPSLIAFEPYETNRNAPKSKTIRHWPYLDPNELTLRGALVMRVEVNGELIYLLEIQRRSQVRKNEEGNLTDTEESFQGLVFTLDDQSSLNRWLSFVLSEVRTVRGVLKKLITSCPGKAATFRHAPASGDQVPCEAAARNALRKMGVF